METIENVTYVDFTSRNPELSSQPMPGPARPVTVRPRRKVADSQSLSHDDEIIERIALGDLEAAELLRKRYVGRLRRTANAILGDEGEVARVVEATLEEACSGWPPERGQVDRWLTRLVRRAAVSRKRALWGLDSSHDPASRRLRLRSVTKSRCHGN